MSEPNGLSKDEWDFWHDWTEAQRALAVEIDRALQAEFGISKAEFSVIVTLMQSSRPTMRGVEIGEALGWEKSRISHLLTRMEARGLIESTEDGAPGRRTGIRLAKTGRDLAQRAVVGHASNIRRFFFDALTPEQASAIRAWSKHMIAGANSA